MKRREFLAGMGALGSGLLLAGCAGGMDTKPGTIAFYNDVSTWLVGYQRSNRALRQASGVTFDIRSVPGGAASYEQVVKSQLQTSRAPDVCKWWNGYRLKDLARLDQLTDVTDLWEAASKKGWLDDSIRGDFSYDKKVYGLPLTESFYPLFYNKRVFDKHDLAPPSSWDELMHVAATVKKAGVTPFLSSQAFPWSFVWFEELVSKLDPGYYERLVAHQASYTDQPGRDALKVWAELIDRGYFTAPDFDLNTAAAQLHAGQVAMWPTGTWNNVAIQTVGMKPGRDYGAFFLPTMEKSTRKSVIVEASALVHPKRGSNPEDTRKLMSHWLDPAVQRLWSGFLVDSAPNPAVTSPDPVIRDVQKFVADTNPTRLNRYWESSPPVLIEGNVQDLSGFMIHPGTAASVLSSMQRRAETEWAYWNEEVS